MGIKVLTVDTSSWNADIINQAIVLGEHADEGEALTGIWRDLQYRAYLLFHRRR